MDYGIKNPQNPVKSKDLGDIARKKTKWGEQSDVNSASTSGKDGFDKKVLSYTPKATRSTGVADNKEWIVDEGKKGTGTPKPQKNLTNGNKGGLPED